MCQFICGADTLFWYLCSWNEDKVSQKSFAIIKENDDNLCFPADKLYKGLTEPQSPDEIGLALPLIHPDRLDKILEKETSSLLKSKEDLFAVAASVTVQERELYRRFCWWRKPVLFCFGCNAHMLVGHLALTRINRLLVRLMKMLSHMIRPSLSSKPLGS